MHGCRHRAGVYFDEEADFVFRIHYTEESLKRLVILGVIAVLPALAQSGFFARHGPARTLEQHADGSVSSNNWSGYVLTGSTFTDAKGSWVQPAIECGVDTRFAAAGFWIGFDGFGNDTVEQTGTAGQCSEGKATYYAWYEFYPAVSVPIKSMKISPGDRISAEVKFRAGEFILTIVDETTGRSFSKKGTEPTAQRATVEWIAEAPCCTKEGSYFPLADFGTALFGGDNTGIAGTNDATAGALSGPFNAFPSANVLAVTMVSPGTGAPESVPSSPSSDGTSFSIQFVAP